MADAVILAGNRPGIDPFAESHNVQSKALIPISGKPMLAYPVEVLTASKSVKSVKILAQDIVSLKDAVNPEGLSKIEFLESRSTIAASLETLLDEQKADFPLLITTADSVLLDDSMISGFRAEAKHADIAIAVVEKNVLLSSYPRSKRTWLRFRHGQYSGANLFYFGSAKARLILGFWAEVEQDRKKGWKMLAIFGPWLLFLAMTRLISIDQLAERVGRKLGQKVAIVKMPQAEACIDVDKETDLLLAEQILATRG